MMIISAMVMTVVISIALSMTWESGNGSYDHNKAESTLKYFSFEKKEKIHLKKFLNTKKNFLVRTLKNCMMILLIGLIFNITTRERERQLLQMFLDRRHKVN